MYRWWNELDRHFSAFDDFRRRVEEAFDETGPAGAYPGRGWILANVYDGGDELRVVADLPGVRAEDLALTVTSDVLTVSGQRKLVLPEGHSLHRQERKAARFSRSFSFPCELDPEKVAANLQDGVLTIRLGKAERARPRQITVQAG